MNMLQENNIINKSSKFISTKFGEESDGYEVESFKPGFKSYKLEKEYFTNFIDKNDYLKKTKLSDLIKYFRNNKSIDNSLFYARDIQIDNLHKITRVINILNESENCDLATGNITDVRKYKYLKDTGIQLYFSKTSNQLHLIAIDVHHLIIIDKNHNKEMEYNKHKENTYNIKKLL